MFLEDFKNKTFPEIDLEILKYWEEKNIFKKTLNKNKGKERFVFYEGPPTANGLPHLGHILPRAFKDLFPRFKTMNGYYCERKGGWDTQGLPVEIEVEKELKISGKNEIEAYGIEKFNQKCKESVFSYVNRWEELTKKMGYFLDMANPYITMDPKYIESIWAILKTLYDKKLLFKDYKVLPYCTRCETPLSSHELSQGYKNTSDTSIYIKFKLEEPKNTYFLAWTTTPWTLPGNVALAVLESALYVKIKVNEEFLILAKDRLEVVSEKYEIVDEFLGKSLLGKQYEPLYNFVSYSEKSHFIIGADFVSLAEGTGIVHTAVMYGADDFKIGKQNKLPQNHVVGLDGKFLPVVTKFAGTYVKSADPLIIQDLEERNLIYKKEDILHEYPFCWRCKSPLIYYALDSYFVKTTDLKNKIIDENEKISWYPDHLKKGRMGDWLNNMVDWSISRSRYWGTPLPIWVCGSCHSEKCIGSYSELNVNLDNFDPHRPAIDNIFIDCTCGGKMTRVPFVLDCWFDSGAMPYAQHHYPFQNKEKFESQFPADFICEAIDQTRGWFYSLLAISVAYTGVSSYKRVLTTGHVLDEKGVKMSKSQRNVVDPFLALEKYGGDIVRWNFYSGGVLGNNFRAGFSNLEETKRRFFSILTNSFSYFVTYSNVLGFSKMDYANSLAGNNNLSLLNKYILSKLNKLIGGVSENLENYSVFGAGLEIESFVINDLSTWYIRHIKSNLNKESLAVLYEVFLTLSKILAPFCPFISEKMYQVLEGDKESVHLEEWPKENINLINNSLEERCKLSRDILEKVYFERQKSGIKLRQVLQKATVLANSTIKLEAEDLEIIKLGGNLKEVEIVTSKDEAISVSLNTEISKELELEGYMRELIRIFQDLRKEKAISYNQKVAGFYKNEQWVVETLEKFKKEIMEQSLLLSLEESDSFKIS